MCLAVPGEVLDVTEDEGALLVGRVRFGTVVQRVCLAYLPEVRPGDWVIAHAGFAIQRLDEAAARRALELLGDGET
ncbi:HypC/HybG/HupF family hydrogenase formation chaperone [Myxococcota bacterium]|nr:HypC/HybG/HupF family hydrogenase formation chaperone [Myxococcota bacterium]